MKKTIIVTTIATLLASSAVPVTAANTALDLTAGTDLSIKSDLLTAQVDGEIDVGVDAGLDASNDGVNADAGVDADADADADADVDSTLDAGVKASANANANASGDMSDNTYGSVMASLKAAADLDISAITEDTSITVITLSELQGNADSESAALDAALTADVDAQAALHSQVEANAAIMAELEAEGFTSEDVVSLKSKADGSIVVYVDDRG